MRILLMVMAMLTMCLPAFGSDPPNSPEVAAVDFNAGIEALPTPQVLIIQATAITALPAETLIGVAGDSKYRSSTVELTTVNKINAINFSANTDREPPYLLYDTRSMLITRPNSGIVKPEHVPSNDILYSQDHPVTADFKVGWKS